MNPLAVSQERIQGVVWLVSLIGCYVSAWRLFEWRRRITGTNESDGFRRAAVVVGALILAITGSWMWGYLGAEIIGRVVHPELFVVEKHP